jgi:SRSO17 transposase
MPKINRKAHQLKRRVAPASTRCRRVRMSAQTLALARAELVAFQALFAPHFGRAEPQAWSAFYLCGPLSDLGRKTMEPMVLALLGQTAAAIRAVQQFIGQSPWTTTPIFQQLETLVSAWLGEPQGVLIVDGSGFPKRGAHSAGVAWQYCGRLGKVENCQSGVFVVYASSKGQAFLRTRLYLPAEWFAASHAQRWQQCGIPTDITFQTEPMIALALLQEVVAHRQVPFRWVPPMKSLGGTPVFWTGLPLSANGIWPKFPRTRGFGGGHPPCNHRGQASWAGRACDHG